MSLKQSHLDSERYTYDYFCKNNVCRLCWNETNDAKSIKNDVTISAKINKYIGIDITSQIPHKVCCTCLDKIENFANFRKLCHIADKKLKIVLTTGRLEKKIKTKEILYDPDILKREAVFELKLLENEVKKEENIDNLIIKQEKENYVNLNIELKDTSILLEENINDFFPNNDDCCFISSLNFKSIESKRRHDVEFHNNRKNNMYKCWRCTKKFSKFSFKISHELQCKVERKCKTCSAITKTDKLFETHMKANQFKMKTKKLFKGLKCNTCSEQFDTRNDLIKHKSVHFTEKEYICEVCGKILKNKTKFSHMMSHNNYKQLKCPHCDYRATLQTTLDVHIRQHTGERPFACDMCPYRCVNSSNLYKHRKTHLGIKDYSCQMCNKNYSHKESLLEHIVAVHEGIKRYGCKRCSALYFHIRDLRKHVLVKHGKRIKKVKDDFVEVQEESYRKMGKRKVGGELGEGQESSVSHEEKL